MCPRSLAMSVPRILVVMTVILTTGVVQNCRFTCRPTHFNISVESCMATESINTTICEGQCYQEDPWDVRKRPRQTTCIGDWVYEVKEFTGCPEGVTYPVARSCKCSMCTGSDTDCESFPMC